MGKKNEEMEGEKQKTCFIIMPISETKEYGPGHFQRVYEYIIEPACDRAGFKPLRADSTKGTQVIIIDILKKIINSDMAICDLSSRNPNVLYELGIRQSFDKPVTLLKDDRTQRIFDIQGFRDVYYHSNLRIDEVNKAVDELAEAIKYTYNNKGKEINSIIELLRISKASIKEPIDISPENTVLLDAIQQLRIDLLASKKLESISKLEKDLNKPWWGPDMLFAVLNNDSTIMIGSKVFHKRYGRGEISRIPNDGTDETIIIFEDDAIGTKRVSLGDLDAEDSENGVK